MVKRRYELSDEQWNKIKLYFESKRGRTYKNLKNTVNGIVWTLKIGTSWRDLPSRYGDWNAVYKCFSKWQKAGLFETILQRFVIKLRFTGIFRRQYYSQSSPGCRL